MGGRCATLASAIKEHTLTHLADYLEEFERNATANGIQRALGARRRRAQPDRLRHPAARAARRTLVKSKSMLTDECDMRPFLENRGIEVIETDLGERIQQLDDEPPSHIVVPAVHKLRGDVARGLRRTHRHRPDEQRRATTSPRASASTRGRTSCSADAGMTGANFAIAETGSFVVCTNEGNADLGAQPAERSTSPRSASRSCIPRIEHLGVFVRLLSRSALGSPITQITSHFRAPREGAEMHVVLVDNGRSERLGMADFWYSLKCIRCGACMNTCPVYRRSGGLSYGATYSGPIGVIIDPTFNLRKYSALPFASTLNGSCTSVCPVKINIHEQIYKWRQIIAERHQLPMVKKEAMQRRRQGPRAARSCTAPRSRRRPPALEHLPRFMIYNPFNAWGRQREVPAAAGVDLPPVVPRRTAGPSDEQPRHDPGRGAAQPAGRRAPLPRGADASTRPSPARCWPPSARRWSAWAARSPSRPAHGARRRFVASASRRRAVICSATPEVRGHARIATVRAAGRARRCRRRRRARRVRRRRDRLGAGSASASSASTRSASWRSTWSCCSIRRRSSPTCTTPTGTRASRRRAMRC